MIWMICSCDDPRGGHGTIMLGIYLQISTSSDDENHEELWVGRRGSESRSQAGVDKLTRRPIKHQGRAGFLSGSQSKLVL